MEDRCTLKRSEMGLARWVVLEGRALVVIVNKVDKLRGGEWAEEREALGKKMATAVPEEIHAALPQVKDSTGVVWSAAFPTVILFLWLEFVMCASKAVIFRRMPIQNAIVGSFFGVVCTFFLFSCVSLFSSFYDNNFHITSNQKV